MLKKFGKKLSEILTGKKLTSETLSEIEDSLILADISPADAENLSEILSKLPSETSLVDIKKALYAEMYPIFKKAEDTLNLDKNIPTVIFVSGLNGAGKTTTLYKLAAHLQKQNKTILVAGCDTFRAGAIQQLKDRMNLLGIETIGEENKSPTSFAYLGLERAIKEQKDILLIDTAGRLHDNENLMAELKKIHKTLQKFGDQYPQNTWLVIDGNAGQNTLSQLNKFMELLPLSGLIITKLDSSSKAGFLYSLLKRYSLPVLFIGHGESKTDLSKFNAEIFTKELLDL